MSCNDCQSRQLSCKSKIIHFICPSRRIRGPQIRFIDFFKFYFSSFSRRVYVMNILRPLKTILPEIIFISRIYGGPIWHNSVWADKVSVINMPVRNRTSVEALEFLHKIIEFLCDNYDSVASSNPILFNQTVSPCFSALFSSYWHVLNNTAAAWN